MEWRFYKMEPTLNLNLSLLKISPIQSIQSENQCKIASDKLKAFNAEISKIQDFNKEYLMEYLSFSVLIKCLPDTVLPTIYPST
jgi:hypothetical protein